jgi:uncharacterized YccA/Bax inhibitor family protein
MADNSRYKQSNNPILSKYEKVDADKDFAAIIQNAGLGDAKVTLNDVIVKTAIMFALTVVFAVIGWNVAGDKPLIWVGAAIVGLVLGLVNAFKTKISVPLMLLYAVAQGVMLGGISNWYNQYAAAQNYQGLVLQAVIGTMTAFGVMLFLYATGIVKVGSKFKKVMLGALISYALIGLVSLVASLFGVGGGWGFYGVSGIGLLLCAAGVLLASFTLLLDFDAIKQGIAMGLPEKESWRMAFGLELTLIWLYLEILRLLAIVAGRN